MKCPGCQVIVRMNGMDTPYWREDLERICLLYTSSGFAQSLFLNIKIPAGKPRLRDGFRQDFLGSLLRSIYLSCLLYTSRCV